MKNKNNYLKFEINDNLKRFIIEANYETTDKNYDAMEIELFLNKSMYDVYFGNIVLRSCKCEKIVNSDSSISISVTSNDSSIVDVLVQPILLNTNTIQQGSLKFINTQYSHQDQTDMFVALVSDNLYKENKQYKFNTNEFAKIPAIDYDQYIFTRSRSNGYKQLWKIDCVSDILLTLEKPHTGQRHFYTPLQFLSGMQCYPLDAIKYLDRNEDGLLIPPIDSIIPIEAVNLSDND